LKKGGENQQKADELKQEKEENIELLKSTLSK
jgi:hypothetical protein